MAKTSQAPAAVCAEHIALSSFFHQVPAPVVRNPIDQSLVDQENYVLPFLKERELTEALAFLAKTKDGSEHIPAVCVEQSSETILNVILAINKSTYADGDTLLQKLKSSFEVVFHVLHNSNYEAIDKSEVQGEIFASIISMCSPRILCRLRIDRKATKRPIHELLKEAIFGIGRIGSQKLQSKDLSLTSSSFISEATKVIQLVDRWMRHQTLDELGDLVEGIYHLKQIAPRFYDLLYLISNHDMNPSSRSSLLNIIKKVSRYWGAARQLYRMAKEFPLVRNMKLQLASLPQKAFESQTNSSEISDLSSCLSRLGFIKGQLNLSQLCHNLKVDENAARARYKGAQKALSAPKIHAEIQIIAFCEIKAPNLFPRVVSSSKDACFLCNTSIQLYGRMHTPRAHGRLYPGWTLPNLPQFRILQQKLNKSLIESLRHSVSLGLAQGKLSLHPQPNESNILTSTGSRTPIGIQELVSESPEGHISSIDSSSITLSDDRPRCGPSSAISRLSNNKAQSDISINTVHLVEGEQINGFVKYNRPFHLIITKSIEVYLGLEDEPSSTARKEPLGYDINRFTPNNIKDLSEKYPVVDVRQLEGEVVLPLSEDNAFCLVAGDVVLKINTHK